MRLSRPSARFAARTALIALGATVLGGAGLASAHVEVDADDADAGAQALLTFSFQHGCDGAPTTELRIQIPESIPAVAPTIDANWTVEKQMIDLETPITDAHGAEITQRVGEVVYTATAPVEDGYRAAVVLSVTLPADAAGEAIYFPVIQTCESGETAWIEIPTEGQSAADLDSPAPSIVVDQPDDDEADTHD